jgi:hypothetical protein
MEPEDGTRKPDWLGFAVQFAFGAVLGAVLGLRWWSKSSYALSTSPVPGVLFIGGGALIFGLIIGMLRDDFWRGFKESSWWRFW